MCGVYAALREAQSVTLTDHHPATLATLRCSVTLNPSLSQPVSVAFLDWDNERALVATPAQRPDAAGRAAGGGDAAAAAAAAAALPPPRAVPSDPEGKPFPVVPEQQRFDVILAADVLCADTPPCGQKKLPQAPLLRHGSLPRSSPISSAR